MIISHSSGPRAAMRGFTASGQRADGGELLAEAFDEGAERGVPPGRQLGAGAGPHARGDVGELLPPVRLERLVVAAAGGGDAGVAGSLPPAVLADPQEGPAGADQPDGVEVVGVVEDGPDRAAGEVPLCEAAAGDGVDHL